MKITPRHLAAGQFTVLGAFCVATWWLLLTPLDRAGGQLELIFAPEYELREFFVWLAVFTVVTVATGIAFWFKKAGARPFASALVVSAMFLFGLSLWWLDIAFILSCMLGLAFAFWSWFRPNIAFERDARKSGARPST